MNSMNQLEQKETELLYLKVIFETVYIEIISKNTCPLFWIVTIVDSFGRFVPETQNSSKNRLKHKCVNVRQTSKQYNSYYISRLFSSVHHAL